MCRGHFARDLSYLDKAFEEAVELAMEGDEGGILHMKRIWQREPNSAQGKSAARVLKSLQIV